MKCPSSDWQIVTRANPCPICGKGDWCAFAPDGKAIRCMRTPSDRETRNGGWFHWLVEPEKRPSPPPRPRDPLPPLPPTRPPEAYGEMLDRWGAGTHPADRGKYAEELGVKPSSLRHLGPVKYAPGIWAFPMRDHAGSVIGIRLRADNGRKWAVEGSQAGLIYADQWRTSGMVLICEGPTDTAAAMSLGFAAIGRPSCLGQEDMLRELLKRYRGHVVIIGDRDAPKKRPDGSVWRPGQEGAERLASALKRPVRLVTPPCKDVRAWLASGATNAAMTALIGAARWRNLR